MALVQQYPDKIAFLPVTIAANQNYSEAINVWGTTICGLSVPNYSFTGTTSVEIGFYGSFNGFNNQYQLLVDATGSFTNAIGAKFGIGGNVLIQLSPILFLPLQYLKLYIYQLQPDPVTFNLILSPVLQ